MAKTSGAISRLSTATIARADQSGKKTQTSTLMAMKTATISPVCRRWRSASTPLGRGAGFGSHRVNRCFRAALRSARSASAARAAARRAASRSLAQPGAAAARCS